MKQFDLKEYLANPSKKVVTRAGTSVRILCTDKRDSTPVVALITDETGREYMAEYNVLGRYCDCEVDTSFDLFFAPEKDKERVTVERFNPNTLKPYDKVLVRDSNIDNWVCDLFSHIEYKRENGNNNRYPYYCLGNNYRCCIPYNDYTKHLIGTSELPSKYYRYWEE